MIILISMAIGLAIAVVALSIALKKKSEEIENLNSECQRVMNRCDEMSNIADYYKNYVLHPKVTKTLTQFIRTDDTPQVIYDRTDRLMAGGFTYSGMIDREHLLVFTQTREAGPSNENKAADQP